MKKLLILTMVVMITGCVVGCSQAPQTTAPKYSANQVIYVAQSKYPTSYRYRSGELLQTPPSVTAQYVGGQHLAWKVVITAPSLYYLVRQLSGISSVTEYFWETDSQLHNTP